MSQTIKTKRIYCEGDQLEEAMVEGLFWEKGGRVYCFAGSASGQESARIYRIIQEYYPLVEIAGVLDVSMLEDAEECVQVEKSGQVIPVRQVGRVKIGNVHLMIKKINASNRQ